MDNKKIAIVITNCALLYYIVSQSTFLKDFRYNTVITVLLFVVSILIGLFGDRFIKRKKENDSHK